MATSFDNLGVIDDDYRVRADFDGWGATFAAGLNQRLGQTVVMITHNLEAAAVAHRRVEIRDGHVAQQGREPQELRAKAAP